MNLFDMEQKHRIFKEADFSLETATPIALIWTDCFIVLFYNPLNEIDRETFNIFIAAARRSSIAIFATVNLQSEGRISKAFNETALNPNNPLNDFSLKEIPAVVIYRDRFPQAFYNGDFTVSALTDFTLSFACNANLHTREQLTGPLNTTTFNQVPDPDTLRLEEI